jgi:hypothetical protein
MGKPIVYCEGCGRNLREEDFAKGRAQMLENRPWCADCKAPAAPPVRGSSVRIPLSGTTPRRALSAARPSKAPLFIGLGVGALALLAVGVVLSTREGGPPPPRKPAAPAAAERAGEDAPPRRPAAAAPDAPKADPTDRYLAQIRGLIESDREFRQKDEVLNLFKATRDQAGTRAAEVDRLRADYERRAADAAKAVELVLAGKDAALSGTKVFLGSGGAVEGINSTDVRVRWKLDVPKSGRYRMELDYALATSNGGRYSFQAGAAKLEGSLKATGSWQTYQAQEIGALELAAGAQELVLVPLVTRGGLMNVRTIRLRNP